MHQAIKAHPKLRAQAIDVMPPTQRMTALIVQSELSLALGA
jgi:hypothetical protein